MAKNERSGRRSGAGKKEFWGHVPTKDGRGTGWGYKDGKVPTAQRGSSRAQVRKGREQQTPH